MLTSSLGVACLAFVVGYLFGSIPFGMILTRLAGTQDLRSIGSGNIGATNVLRTGRKGLAAATLLGDMLKGTAAVILAGRFGGPEAAMLAALGAFLGHLFPVWLGFKGGKGVATYIGVLLGLSWIVGLIFCAVWLVIALAQRLSSLAALTAAATAPIFTYVVTGDMLTTTTTILLSLLLIVRHWSNIGRLIQGTEPKIGGGKKA
jgi:glycerol-3-phosphate acyltransferase PlsY